MKTKYFLIYVCVGAAFLAVSAWVFFTHGKNAKAIRAKYKLGGIMLTCMAMLSIASCGEIMDPGDVMCYDPVIEEPAENITRVTFKQKDASYKYNEMSPGDVFNVDIQVPTFDKYVLRVILNDTAGTDLQKTKLVITDKDNAHFEIPLSTDVTYKGEALVQVQGIVKEDPEELTQMCYFVALINIR